MINRVAVTTLLATSLGSASVLAQDQTPVQRGRAVAERRCAACHAVRPGETASPNAAATSFTRVAATPGMTELALQATLQTSHRTMPNLILNADGMREVIACIPRVSRNAGPQSTRRTSTRTVISASDAPVRRPVTGAASV